MDRARRSESTSDVAKFDSNTWLNAVNAGDSGRNRHGTRPNAIKQKGGTEYNPARCGPEHNNQKCQPGAYCSKFGWCGNSTAHQNNVTKEYDGPPIFYENQRQADDWTTADNWNCYPKSGNENLNANAERHFASLDAEMCKSLCIMEASNPFIPNLPNNTQIDCVSAVSNENGCYLKGVRKGHLDPSRKIALQCIKQPGVRSYMNIDRTVGNW